MEQETVKRGWFKPVATVILLQAAFVAGVMTQPALKAYFADKEQYDTQKLASFADVPIDSPRLSDNININNGVY